MVNALFTRVMVTRRESSLVECVLPFAAIPISMNCSAFLRALATFATQTANVC